jgi:hypothetical protein
MPFEPKAGAPCSFYHSGGCGERRWVIGWRYGIVRAVPSKGHKFGFVQIELTVPRWTQDLVTRQWTRKPNEKVWVSRSDVNAVGDYTNHGPALADVVKQRKQVKAAEQAKADKKMRAGKRFTR